MDYIAILVICILLRGVSSEGEWSMSVSGNVTAFHHSCIVIPCNCTFPKDLTPGESAMIWFKDHDAPGNEVDCSTNSKKVQSDYNRCGSLLNSTALNNCTLLIENVSQSDGGNYLFRLEVNQESKGKYTYRKYPVYIHVSDLPNDPVLRAPGSIVEQIPANLSCQTNYSCLLEPPNISWTGLSRIISIKQSPMLLWQYSSTVTFEPSYKDHGKTVKCLVQYPRMKVARMDHINLTIKYSPRNTHVAVEEDGNWLETGEHIPLTCVTDSNPEPHNYTWLQKAGDTEVSLSQYTRRITVSRDSGSYICIAFNSIGSEKSTPEPKAGNAPVSWTIILTICGVCLFTTIVLVLTVLKYRSTRNGQRDVAGSTSFTEMANPTEASRMAKNVSAHHEEPVYCNTATNDLHAIYANSERKRAACNPGGGQREAASAGSPRKLEEELYINLSSRGWSGAAANCTYTDQKGQKVGSAQAKKQEKPLFK
ncbi:B-cell receptor CD22-like [Scyliorhinus torazame]|uniref:B-cell receptor CD22-like n=1 Tax=Scyliorhinus torazame TaxID=75743 RepID=UPI003B5CF012